MIGESPCTKKLVTKELKKYFQREYKCGLKFDPEGTKPSETKLAKCLDKNEKKKDKKIAECEADSDAAPVESESTVDPDPVESESTVDPDPVDPASPEEDGCTGVPVAIPTSCSAYTCDAILEIY